MDDPQNDGPQTDKKDPQIRLQAKVRQLAAIADLGLQAAAAGGLDELLQHSLATVTRTLNVEYSTLLRLTPDGRALRILARQGWPEAWFPANTVESSPRRQPGFTLQSEGPVFVPDYAKESRFEVLREIIDFGIAAGMSVAIRSGGKPWGVLNVHSRSSRAFSEDDADFLQSVANLLAATVDRFETQRQLAANERRLQLAQRIAGLGCWELNINTNALFWTDEIFHMFGEQPGSFEPSLALVWERIVAEDRDGLVQTHKALLRGETPPEVEYRIVRSDGSICHVRQRSATMFNPTGEPEYLVGTTLDITGQVEREVQLRRQALLLDQARDAIIVRDLANRITYWNRAAELLYGWSTQEALQRPVDELLYPNDRSGFERATRRVVEQGAWSGRLLQYRRDGSPLTVECRWTLVNDEEGCPQSILAINTDISERLDLEMRLEQAQKLESIGQLTGGIAHDFNNLLTVIIGNAELLGEEIDADSPLWPLTDMVRTAAERGAELTQRLLAFARRQALMPSVISPDDVIEGLLNLLKRTLGASIEIRFQRDPDLWTTFVDVTQLESAILNLTINARDAMPGGGVLTLETANVILDEHYAALQHAVQPGPYVQIVVSDNGRGMTPEVLERVFDPFFTTKPKGKGTGLGLSMVYGFVRQSGGHVKVYSEPGHGTAISIYLPRADIAGEVHPQPERTASLHTGGDERILLVEDDDLVREHAFQLLRDLGYEVTAASCGPDALALLRGGLQVDLLFTDVIMPGGMNGPQLAAATKELLPDLPVLFTSGYTENAIVHHGRLDPGVLLLHKPYRRQTLAAKVRLALDAPTAPAGDVDASR